MKKIDSFKVDHRKLLPGLYVSRVDHVNGWPVTTFDLRVCRPNHDHMEVAAAHTLEHIIATLLRSGLWRFRDIFRANGMYDRILSRGKRG